MKIILFGDSFGYQKNNNAYPSWVDLLSSHTFIDNKCQCGISEYKILQQIKNSNLDEYDKIVITHTSPYRTFVKYNPLHFNSDTHRDCDIILADVESRTDDFSVACQQYFKYIFDPEYAIDVHNMICTEIDLITKNYDTIHITHFDYLKLKCYQFKNFINFYPIWEKNRGPVNHYNEYGNQQVYETVLKRLL